MADMFSKKNSYLFKNTKHFVLYLLNERLGHLGVLKRGDEKLRNHVEKHRNIQLKPGYILSLIFPVSGIEEISASYFLHLNLKYWQTIFWHNLTETLYFFFHNEQRCENLLSSSVYI